MNKDIPFNPLEGEKPEITFKLNDTTDELVSIIIVHKDRPEFLNIALQILKLLLLIIILEKTAKHS